MNRFSNAPPFVNRASPGQGGRFRGGENRGRPQNNGGRNVPPLPEKNSVRDYSSSRGRGGYALSGSRRPVTDQESVAMEVKPLVVPNANETMLTKESSKTTTPAKVDGMVNGGSINSMEMNKGYGHFNGSNNEGMFNGIGRESSKTATFDHRPAMEVVQNGGAIDMGQQQPMVNGVGGHHVLLGQHNHKVVEGLAEMERLAKSDDVAALKKLTATLMRTLATAFNDFADSMDKMNSSTTQGGGH